MQDRPPMGTGRNPVPSLVQEILSGIPAGCTWLLPLPGPDGQIVDFQIAATSDQTDDLYRRGAGRRDARLSDLYPSMVGGRLWELYHQVCATGVVGRLADFRYEDKTAGVVAESLFEVTVSPALGGLLVWWQRVDEDRRRLELTEQLGRL